MNTHALDVRVMACFVSSDSNTLYSMYSMGRIWNAWNRAPAGALISTRSTLVRKTENKQIW